MTVCSGADADPDPLMRPFRSAARPFFRTVRCRTLARPADVRASTRWSSSAVRLAGATLLALGLSATATAERGGGSATAEPMHGGRLNVAADIEPRNLNPAIVASNGVFFIASKIVEPLAEMGPSGLEPRLARAWQGSADGMSFRVELEPGIVWSDGEPLTSRDVAFSALEVWKPLQNIGRELFVDLEAVDTPDELTAVFRFSSPVPGQLIENAIPAVSAVLPSHLLEGRDIETDRYNLEPIGTGPFRLDEHRNGEFYRLVRNERFRDDDKPYLDEIVFRVLPDAVTRATALETGDLDVVAFSAVPLTDLRRLDALDGVTTHAAGYSGLTYTATLEMNHDREPLGDVRVRRAIAHAIDPRFMTDVIFRGFAEPATGPLPSTAEPFYTDEVARYAFDPERAAALLDEAGYTIGEDGDRFSLTLRPAPWFEQTRAAGEYVAQALAAIDLDVRIEVSDPAAHVAAVYTDRDFDLAIGSPVYRNDPAISTTVLYRGGIEPGVPFANQYGYDSATMNSLIDRGRTTIDRDERTAIYREFQQLAMRELPILPLVHFAFQTVARDAVMNVGDNPRWAVSNWADVWLDDPD